jgi:dihydrofolate reductase
MPKFRPASRRSLKSAFRQAKVAAGDKDVSLMGGATVNQYLTAGLIDEMYIILAPILLGGGSRPFSGSGYPLDWELKSIFASEAVTHMQLTRGKS